MEGKTKSQKLARIAILVAITIILVATPLGYIPINPLVTVTIMVTPVVLGGMLYGWQTGLLLGFVFGLSSFLRAPTEPLGQIMLGQSGLKTFLVCVVPRLLVGLVGALACKFLQNKRFRRVWVYALTGLAASLVNTICFLCAIWFMFDSEQTKITGAVILGVVSFNGLLEAVANSVLVSVLAKVTLGAKAKQDAEKKIQTDKKQ